MLAKYPTVVSSPDCAVGALNTLLKYHVISSICALVSYPRPRGVGGTGRLLQRAIQGIHGRGGGGGKVVHKQPKRIRPITRETSKQSGGDGGEL